MNRAPWYVIVLRLTVMPIVMVGIGLLALGTGIGWGREAMMDVFNNEMPGWK